MDTFKKAVGLLVAGLLGATPVHMYEQAKLARVVEDLQSSNDAVREAANNSADAVVGARTEEAASEAQLKQHEEMARKLKAELAAAGNSVQRRRLEAALTAVNELIVSRTAELAEYKKTRKALTAVLTRAQSESLRSQVRVACYRASTWVTRRRCDGADDRVLAVASKAVAEASAAGELVRLGADEEGYGDRLTVEAWPNGSVHVIYGHEPAI